MIKDLKCQNIHMQTDKINSMHKTILLLHVLHSKIGPSIMSTLNNIANSVFFSKCGERVVNEWDIIKNCKRSWLLFISLFISFSSTDHFRKQGYLFPAKYKLESILS